MSNWAYDWFPYALSSNKMFNARVHGSTFLGMDMTTDVLNAVDMSIFEDNFFDIVLNFGPLYHLVKLEDRENCIKESLRVLKPGGLLAIAYISRFSAYQYVVLSDRKYLSEELMNKIIDNGYIEHTDKNCFWTDAYYYSVDEIERFMHAFGVKLVDHVATDGISPLMKDKIDNMDDNEYKIWLIALYKEDLEGQEINENKIRRTVNESIKNPQKVKIILIQYDEVIIGYSILVLYWSNEFGGNILNIDELYIDKEFRGKGIATDFIRNIQIMFSDIVALQLETTPSNDRVMKYYHRIGFVNTNNTHMIYVLNK